MFWNCSLNYKVCFYEKNTELCKRTHLGLFGLMVCNHVTKILLLQLRIAQLLLVFLLDRVLIQIQFVRIECDLNTVICASCCRLRKSDIR